jgi:hypothetical protein
MFAGIPSLFGGLWRDASRPHSLIHWHVRDSEFVSCCIARHRKRVLHFASTLIRFQPPSYFGQCKIDKGTLKMSPSHRKRAHIVCSCRKYCFGGGNICARNQTWAYNCSCMILTHVSSVSILEQSRCTFVLIGFIIFSQLSLQDLCAVLAI